MNIIIKNNYEEVSQVAADFLLNTVKDKKNAVLGLPTGSTPIGMYEKVVEEHKKGNVSFKDIKTFNLDEYVNLDRDNINSYYYFMNSNLFSHIDIDKNNIHIPNGMADDVEKECMEYEEKLQSSGSMDILFLGIGINGHIGFNEPGESFQTTTHVTHLEHNTIEANARFFDKLEDVPTTALTMGMKTILSAKKIVLIATGENKANAVNEMVNGKVTPKMPASVLQLHNDVTIIIDNLAASKLN